MKITVFSQKNVSEKSSLSASDSVCCNITHHIPSGKFHCTHMRRRMKKANT